MLVAWPPEIATGLGQEVALSSSEMLILTALSSSEMLILTVGCCYI